MKLLTIFISAMFLFSVSAYAAIPKKVKVSSNDSTSGYLNGKLVAGTGITFTEGSDGGDETLTITTAFSASPASNTTASGIVVSFVANEDQVFGDIGYINADGEIQIGDADAIATASCAAMAVESISADASGNYLLFGVARNDSWNWTVGGLIYLSTDGVTGSVLTQTAPSGTDDVIQVIGVAIHADRMIFNPNLLQVEHV